MKEKTIKEDLNIASFQNTSIITFIKTELNIIKDGVQ